MRGSSPYSADELPSGLTPRDLDQILGPGGQATGEDPDLTTFLDQCVALGEAAKRLRERIRNTPRGVLGAVASDKDVLVGPRGAEMA